MEELSSVRRKIRVEKLRIVEETYGIRVGSVVVVKGADYRVTKVDVRWGRDKPWLEGNPRKKDGTFGSRKRNLYSDWELKHSQK
jgi:hypothetical protein